MSFWAQLFGDDQPVEVEIGPERGSFLLASAAAHPERNYFGIERSASRVRRLEAAVAADPRGNIRVLNADATCAITQFVPPASVSTYHVYFPDPWWKLRHHRRRLMTPAFAAVLARTLVPGGRIHLVTDVEETFLLAVTSLDTVSALMREPSTPPRPIRTAFEQKALQRGSAIHSVTYRKTRREGSA